MARTHQTSRLVDFSRDFGIAAEYHVLGGSGRVLVCFVPGGATSTDPALPITSSWEQQQLRVLTGAGCDGLTLSFPGIGQSEGRLLDNTLERRVRWVMDLVDFAAPSNSRGPLVLVGRSMGGHVAAMVANALSARALALVAPAAYGSDTVNKSFGAAFRDAIRRPASWRDSPAFKAVEEFPGRVLFLLPAQDEVIPAEVTRRYELAAAGRGRSIWLDGATHDVFSSDRPEDRQTRVLACRHIAQLAYDARSTDPLPAWDSL